MKKLSPLLIAALLVACDDPAPDNTPNTTTFELEHDAFVVEPGEERLHCQRMTAPASLGDAPMVVRSFSSELPAPTHHYFMGFDPEPEVEAGVCTGSENQVAHGADGAKFLFGAGVGSYSMTLPDGYGIYLPSGAGHFVSDHHVVNFGTEPATLWGRFTVEVAATDTIPHPVQSLACVQTDISIPAMSETAINGTCVTPFAIDLVVLSSHAHQYLDHVEIRIYDGDATTDQVIYRSDNWDSPAIEVLEQPIRLEQGQGLTFTCHYTNPTGNEIIWGADEFGEMCATINGYALPGDRAFELPPTLGTVIGDNYNEYRLCPVLGPDCCDKGICELVDTTHIDGAF